METEQRDCGLHTLVADVALMTGRKVLLARYNDVNKYDHQEGWFIPDDALNHFESGKCRKTHSEGTAECKRAQTFPQLHRVIQRRQWSVAFGFSLQS